MHARHLCLAAAFALVLGAGCYSPKIEDGKFLCGPGDSCPSGFRCSAGRCYKGAAPDGSSPGDTGPTCEAQKLECSPPLQSTGACDPVCQTGCACGRRCTNRSEANVCTDIPQAQKDPDQRCSASVDDCRPGSVCLEYDTQSQQPACGAFCYRFCRVDSDCGPRARCTAAAESTRTGEVLYKVCSAKLEMPACNPTGPQPECSQASRGDRPFPMFACYLLSHQRPDETVCECAGTIPAGQRCVREYQCVPGHECLSVGGDARCRKLCTLPTSGVVPPVLCTGVGETCNAFAGSTRYGFCM